MLSRREITQRLSASVLPALVAGPVAGQPQLDCQASSTGTDLRPRGARPEVWPAEEDIRTLFIQGQLNRRHPIYRRVEALGGSSSLRQTLPDWYRLPSLPASSPVFEGAAQTSPLWPNGDFVVNSRRLRHLLGKLASRSHQNGHGNTIDVQKLLDPRSGPKTVVIAIRGAVYPLATTRPEAHRRLHVAQPDFHNFRCTVIVWKMTGNAGGTGDLVSCFPASTVPNRQSILRTLGDLRSREANPDARIVDCNMMLDGVYRYTNGNHGIRLEERLARRRPFSGISNVLRGHENTPCVRPVPGARDDVATLSWEPITSIEKRSDGRAMASFDNVHLAETEKIQSTALFSSEGCITIPGYLVADCADRAARVVGLFADFQKQAGLVGPGADAGSEIPFIMCSSFRYLDAMCDFPP